MLIAQISDMHLSTPDSRIRGDLPHGGAPRSRGRAPQCARAEAGRGARDRRPGRARRGARSTSGCASSSSRFACPSISMPGNHDDRVMPRASVRPPSLLAARRRVHPVRRRGLAGAAGGPRHADPGRERRAALRRAARLARRAPCRGAGAADRGVHASPAVRHRHAEDGRDGARRHRRTRRR